MCGIAGIVTSKASRHLTRLNKMLETIEHRGPDGKKIVEFENCLLGHTRLSIIDLSTGDQPMKSSGSDKTIIFNGEIYGYKDIKKTLHNYKFLTNSDTEVILALYEKHGDKVSKYLSGMFSFAIYNPMDNSLFCSRDRFGEKPFYYAVGDRGEFIFGSEIKAILASGLIDPILDKSSLSYYIQHLYIHPTETIYQNIKVLSPGHSLTFKNGKININRYWNLPQEINFSESFAIEKFSVLLKESVKQQLVADVQVGILLSGGLDSSTITAIANMYQKKIKTFSFGFEGRLNELSYARSVAKKYGTDHHEFYEHEVKVSELLYEMQEIYDEPFADSSNIPTYLIGKLASKYCKVVLGGDGGDEMLMGYDWYKPFATIPKHVTTFLRFFFSRNISRLHDLQNSYFSDNEIRKLNLYSPNNFRYIGLNSEKINQIQRIDIQNYLPGDILVKVDRVSMANSLEVRTPFLNLELAEFCLSLPSKLKIKKGVSKWLLRQAFSAYWPEELKDRPKQGFASPIKNWLLRRDLIKLKRGIEKNNHHKIFSIFPRNQVLHYLNQPNYKGWIILNTALWLERHNFKNI